MGASPEFPLPDTSVPPPVAVGSPAPVGASSAGPFVAADAGHVSVPATTLWFSWPPSLGHPAGGWGDATFVPLFTTSVLSPGPLVTFALVSALSLLVVNSGCGCSLFPVHAFER